MSESRWVGYNGEVELTHIDAAVKIKCICGVTLWVDLSLGLDFADFNIETCAKCGRTYRVPLEMKVELLLESDK